MLMLSFQLGSVPTKAEIPLQKTYCIPVTTSEGFRKVEERDVLATVNLSLNLKMCSPCMET